MEIMNIAGFSRDFLSGRHHLNGTLTNNINHSIVRYTDTLNLLRGSAPRTDGARIDKHSNWPPFSITCLAF